MRRRIFIAALAAVAVAGAAALIARAPATGTSAPFSGKPEIVAATFASAWCSSCKVLQPKLAKVIPSFAGEPVAFVDLDFTFGPRAEIKALAERFAIGALYERNKGATGFTVLVDHDTGEILDTLTMNFSESAMRSAIARALSIASHTDDRPPADGPRD